MPRLPRLKAAEAESLLIEHGFAWVRSQGSHRIYFRGSHRVVIPYHEGRILHPKIVKQVFVAIGRA